MSKDPRNTSQSQPNPRVRPDWAYSMTDDQYLNMNFDPLPAPQRIRKHAWASLTDSPQNSSETSTIKNTNTTTTDNQTANNMDTNTNNMDTITTSSPPTTTIPTTSITTPSFANTLSNMSHYKEDLIQKLLGKQGRAATTNTNNTLLLYDQ